MFKEIIKMAKRQQETEAFITISKRELWNKLEKIEDLLQTLDINNSRDHIAIIEHQKRTNGRVTMNRKLIYTLGGAGGTAFLFLLNAIFKFIS